MLNTVSARRAAGIVLLASFLTIVGAWAFERAGFAPCDLCLKQRWAYYFIVPFTFALVAVNPSWIRAALWLGVIVLAANAVFGVYHSGVEWKLWAGPGTCGAGLMSGGLPDLGKPVVKCDEAALRILGLSLAGWNAVISGAMAFVASVGARAR
jgi:disulfide bond formation protein DsbB